LLTKSIQRRSPGKVQENSENRFGKTPKHADHHGLLIPIHKMTLSHSQIGLAVLWDRARKAGGCYGTLLETVARGLVWRVARGSFVPAVLLA
jgi:hypothetical protein